VLGMMRAIGEAIGFRLSNLPGFLFVGALVVALLVKGREYFFTNGFQTPPGDFRLRICVMA
jgi:hypothetical protein